jgi:hypothetical protein
LIGSIDAKGTNATYQFVDKDLKSTHSIYRLKLIDKNGTFTYSKSVDINTNSKKKVTGYPNPFGAFINIDLGIKPTMPLDYRIMNMDGKCFQKGTLIENVTNLPTAAFKAGIYLLNLSDGRSIQLIKQ